MAGTPGWEETVKNFTETGKLLKENGIQQLYHNHDFEFNKADGKFLLDWLYETISPEYLQPQIDTCWVHYAGYDPAEYLLKYSGRIKVVHLKDFICEKFGNGPVYELIGKADESNASQEDNGFKFRPVGHGVQNMPSILEAADKAGAEIVIVEQDLSYEQPSMEAAKTSRDYLKNLGL